MKILWYGKWENVDGNHVYMKTLSAIQADRGHQVIVTFFGDDRTNLEDRHPKITYFPLPYLYKTQPWTLSHPSALARFREILDSYQPDLVHASLAVASLDLFIPTVCKQVGIPFVATFHVSFANHIDRYSLFSYFNHLLYKRTLLAASRVIIFSERQRRYLHSILNIPLDWIEVIPNGVNSEIYTPGPSKFREGIDADFVVGYLGRLAPEKNVEKLCRAFVNIDDERSYLVILGKGICQKKLIRKYGGHPRIVFAGYLSRDADKIDILRGFDVFVLPSSIEGYSISQLEAMSCGVPPLVTDVGGNGDLARGCGIILDPRKILKGVEDALRALRQDSTLTKSIGRRVRRKVKAHLSWEDNCARLETVYEEVIGRYVSRRYRR